MVDGIRLDKNRGNYNIGYVVNIPFKNIHGYLKRCAA
jgi:hypothetical protein